MADVQERSVKVGKKDARRWMKEESPCHFFGDPCSQVPGRPAELSDEEDAQECENQGCEGSKKRTS